MSVFYPALVHADALLIGRNRASKGNLALPANNSYSADYEIKQALSGSTPQVLSLSYPPHMIALLYL